MKINCCARAPQLPGSGRLLWAVHVPSFYPSAALERWTTPGEKNTEKRGAWVLASLLDSVLRSSQAKALKMCVYKVQGS